MSKPRLGLDGRDWDYWDKHCWGVRRQGPPCHAEAKWRPVTEDEWLGRWRACDKHRVDGDVRVDQAFEFMA